MGRWVSREVGLDLWVVGCGRELGSVGNLHTDMHISDAGSVYLHYLDMLHLERIAISLP